METIRVLDRALTRDRLEADGGTGQPELGAVYDRYAGPLYRFVLTLLSNAEEAEDAVQEVFVGLLRRGGPGGIRDLHAYLFQAARRQAIEGMRRRRRRERESEAAAVSWIDLEACPPERLEVAMDVDRAIRRLPTEQREVVALRLGAELTFREIAAALEIPLPTAASRYRLALQRLRALFEED